MAEYRTLSVDEYPNAVKLWTDVFRVEEEFFTSLLDGGTEEDNLSFAAVEDGEIVSSVHVFMRQIRDREGTPLKVGGIGSVSTHPEHRKKGHSGRLLELAIKGMEDAGCVWSFLGTGVNDHYARYGWRTVSTPYFAGKPRSGAYSDHGTKPLRVDEATLDELVRLHEPTAGMRPMATVRTKRAWETAIHYRLSPNQAQIFGAFDGGMLEAYLVVRGSGPSVRFAEVAGKFQRYRDLIVSVAAALHGNDVKEIVCELPQTADLMEAFAEATAGSVWPGEGRGMMLRPIADRISWPDLFALYGDPKGRHSDLDAF